MSSGSSYTRGEVLALIAPLVDATADEVADCGYIILVVDNRAQPVGLATDLAYAEDVMAALAAQMRSMSTGLRLETGGTDTGEVVAHSK